MEIRKSIVGVEEVVTDGGKPLASPIHRATAVVVVKNPLAGRFVDDLSPLFVDISKFYPYGDVSFPE